jgi:hypothetical protein
MPQADHSRILGSLDCLASASRSIDPTVWEDVWGFSIAV